MDKVDEILEFIVSDIEKAFDLLDEVFSKINGIYDDLDREFYSQPNNFSEENFRRKLRRFVKSNRKDIINYYASVNLDTSNRKCELSPDHIYEILCKLNFDKQVDHFNWICKCKKSLIPFVIRANDDFGQHWLCTRLINTYKADAHEPIIFNLENTIGYDLQLLVEELIKKLLEIDVWKKWHDKLNSFTPEQKVEKSRNELVDLLSRKTETATQFVIIKNAFNHIDSKSDKFLNFRRLLIDLNDKMYATDHKCIFIFIEKRPEQYTCEEYLCTHTHDDSFEAMKIVEKEKLRIVGLQEIKEFTDSDIKNWLGNESMRDDIFHKLINSNHTELVAQKHPEQVIRDICSELGITFQDKWIKH